VKLLGTGADGRFGLGSVDLTRWAAITVTDGPAPEFPHWARLARAACRVELRPLASRGRWAGAEPFTPPADQPGWDGPELALTRARLRPSRALTFWRSIGASAPPAGQPGLWASFGVGEAPVGWQGTVSLWRHRADLVDFAYRQPGHRRAIERTPTVGWYAEELFARFAVLGVTGDARVLGLPEGTLSAPPGGTGPGGTGPPGRTGQPGTSAGGDRAELDGQG
jgi:hypothetical protein